MIRGASGQYLATMVAGRPAQGFLPGPLPPDPPPEVGADLRDVLDTALLALGRLDSVTTLLPSTELFLYTYVRKEAVLSSQIEGTQSTLSDLLLFELDEAPGVPFDDVIEVSNYVAALNRGVEMVRGGFPLSNRLFREVHRVLLERGRGSDRDPGEFRRTQNWLGTPPDALVYVPPPAPQVEPTMAALERWLNGEPEPAPVLLKAALAHVQFESIHPFLDGNGRVGRLLIPLLFCADGVLREPLLYLSLYFKQHRSEYYDLLQRVRTDGDWESWITFFARGVAESATGAVTTAQRLVALFQAHRARIQGIGRTAGSALRVHDSLQRRPLGTIPAIAGMTGLTRPTVAAALEGLAHLGIAREITGRKSHRVYSYEPYVRILNEGTEPL